MRYWVIGGRFSDCGFESIEPGTERLRGPYADAMTARTEWQRLTFRDHVDATTRYAILAEPVRP